VFDVVKSELVLGHRWVRWNLIDVLNFESNDAIKYCVLREVIIRVQHRNDRVLLM